MDPNPDIPKLEREFVIGAGAWPPDLGTLFTNDMVNAARSDAPTKGRIFSGVRSNAGTFMAVLEVVCDSIASNPVCY